MDSLIENAFERLDRIKMPLKWQAAATMLLVGGGAVVAGLPGAVIGICAAAGTKSLAWITAEAPNPVFSAFGIMATGLVGFTQIDNIHARSDLSRQVSLAQEQAINDITEGGKSKSLGHATLYDYGWFGQKGRIIKQIAVTAHTPANTLGNACLVIELKTRLSSPHSLGPQPERTEARRCHKVPHTPENL